MELEQHTNAEIKTSVLGRVSAPLTPSYTSNLNRDLQSLEIAESYSPRSDEHTTLLETTTRAVRRRGGAARSCLLLHTTTVLNGGIEALCTNDELTQHVMCVNV